MAATTPAAAGVGIPTKYFEPPGAIPCTLNRARRHAADEKEQAASPRQIANKLGDSAGSYVQSVHTPGVGHHCRRDAKTDNVSERIELQTKLRARAGHAGHAAIQGIEDNGKPDRDRGVVKVVPCAQQSGDDRVVSAKKIRRSEQAGQQKNPAPQPGAGAYVVPEMEFRAARFPPLLGLFSRYRRADIRFGISCAVRRSLSRPFWQQRKNAGTAFYGVANFHLNLRVTRNPYIRARPESYQTDAFAARDLVAGLLPTYHAAGDQSGNLLEDEFAGVGRQAEDVLFVFE